MGYSISNNLVGIAGVHYVVSELSRRGMVALPTVRNIAAYDILVANVEGTKHANIQVKASLKNAQFFLMPPPEKIKAGGRDWYVLVRWSIDKQGFEGFMLRGKEAKTEVLRNEKEQKKKIAKNQRGVLFPALHVSERIAGAKPKKWLKRWRTWTLSKPA